MRPLVLAALLGAVALPIMSVAPHDAQAGDFDPSGRGKKPKKPKKPTGNTDPPTGNYTPPKTQPGAGEDDKGKTPEKLIARYTAIVLAQPAAPFPIQRLATLYRERDGNLKKLLEEFENRAAGTGDDAWAAKVALAGFYKQDGRYEDAIKTYEEASTAKPKESAPLMALAQLQVERGSKADGRASYDKALPLLTEAADIEQTTRTLMGLCLDLQDWEAAKKHHTSLVNRSQNSMFVKGELGRELLARNEFERAEAEFRELVKAASGDNRALAPAYRDLGTALLKEKKTTEAIDVLKKALAAASAAAGVRAEIFAIMTDAFRAEGKLPELIEILEKDGGQDFQRISRLGGLYEETGNVDKALDMYRKALAIDGSHVDTRIRVVHLLQTAGKLDEAIKEYEEIIRVAPNSPEFVFELCETHIQRGDRPKALKLLQELESRAQEDDVLAAIADFYERVEEKDKAMAVLQRLATSTGSDPTFLVELGDRYYQAGDKKKALDTWARIKVIVQNKARAAYMLGDVYLNHDMPDEALEALREAATAEPNNLQFKKTLAVALERTAPGTPYANDRFNEAVRIWEELLRSPKSDKNVTREARTHIVSVWSVLKELPNRVAPLQQRFEADPPDLEAGRLLAEVQRKLTKLADAEATLRKVLEKDPGDEASMLALERILVQGNKLDGAIEVLGKLAERDKQGALQYYQRMSGYARDLKHDDDAIKYAAMAVELSPENASGHKNLGDMYKARQDFPKAIASYRMAILKNDRLFPVYFDLAELLKATGDPAEADKLLRRVVRSSNDEDLISKAALASLQLNVANGTLETLERDLLPVAVGNPQKPVYRRRLIDVYRAMTVSLVGKIRNSTNPKEIADAQAQLAAIGGRALKPLLDTLADDREQQQQVAIDILAYVQNKAAGPTLFNFATGTADKQMRTRAMIAVGALGDPEMLPKLEQLLTPKQGDVTVVASDDLALAAAWAVARTRDAKAEVLLGKLLEASSPDVRAVAAIGLGLTKNKKHGAPLVALAKAAEAGPSARAAALLGLGQLVTTGGLAPDKELTTLVASLLEATDPLLRRAALVLASRIQAQAGDPLTTKSADAAATLEALAQGILSSDAALRQDSIAAAAALLNKGFADKSEPLPVPIDKLNLNAILIGLMPATPTAAARLNVLVALEPHLQKAAVAAVATSPDRAAIIADSLAEGAIFAPFAVDATTTPPELQKKAEAATRKILDATTPGFTQLVKHPDAAVRTKAAQVLALSATKEAQDALARALEDGDEALKRAILQSIAFAKSEGLLTTVANLLAKDESWAVRVRAAETLGRLGTTDATHEDAVKALSTAAKSDGYALVREAALVSLASVDAARAKPVLEDAAKNDAETRVRETAQRLLEPAQPAAH
ncbi:MAG: HEAT repeat domain-containing protein [Polyangiaceae bacterium]